MKLNCWFVLVVCMLFMACINGLESDKEKPAVYTISELDSADRPRLPLSDRVRIRMSIIEDSTLASGMVTVAMIIGEDGKISGARVQNGLGKREDAVALQRIKGLPSFFPGKRKGKAVKVVYFLPFVFNPNAAIDSTRKR